MQSIGKAALAGLAHDGEFVQWLAENLGEFETRYCDDAVELGTLNALQRHWDSAATTRFFNRITYRGNEVVKEAVIAEYAPMIDREIAWYEQVTALGFPHVPALLGTTPLTLARIDGLHPISSNGVPRDGTTSCTTSSTPWNCCMGCRRSQRCRRICAASISTRRWGG